MGWVDLELVLISLAAMLSPTALTFSVLSLVLAKRPLRTGVWFYLGAFTVTVAIGVAAAFVLGDVAAPSSNGERKTWVSIFDLVAGALLLVYVSRTWRKPIGEKTTQGMVEKMTAVASRDGSPSCRRRDARKPRRLHPAGAEGDLGDQPDDGGLRRGLAPVHGCLAPSAEPAILLLLVSPAWAERVLVPRASGSRRTFADRSVIILLLAVSSCATASPAGRIAGFTGKLSDG